MASMANLYGYAVDEERAVATVLAAFDSPINFVDTGTHMRLDFWKLLTAGASAAAIATVLTMASPANAATVYDNLGSSQDGSDPVFGYGPLANSFMTHAGAGFLTRFQALEKVSSWIGGLNKSVAGGKPADEAA